MHARQQLRDAVVTAVTGLATTGARVSTARVYPLQEAELPHIEVNTVSESAQTAYMVGAVSREVLLEVTGIARGTSGLANTLDDIAEEVEAALGARITVSGVVVDLLYEGSEIQFSGDADQPIGNVVIRYRATLCTDANAPGTLI